MCSEYRKEVPDFGACKTYEDYIGEYEAKLQEVIDSFEYLATGTGGKSYTAETIEDISEIITEIMEILPDVVVDPDEPIDVPEEEDDEKDDSLFALIWRIMVAPFAFLYMIFSKLIDSAYGAFSELLAFIERIFKR